MQTPTTMSNFQSPALRLTSRGLSPSPVNTHMLLAPTKEFQRPGSTPTLRSRAVSSIGSRPPFPVFNDPTGNQSNPPSLSSTQSVQSINPVQSNQIQSINPVQSNPTQSVQSVQSNQIGPAQSNPIQSVQSVQSVQSAQLNQSIQPAHQPISPIIPNHTSPPPSSQADFLARIVGGGDTGLNNA